VTALPVPASAQTVLVAEDDPDLLFLIEIRLTKAGYNVVSACNGRQAMERVTECEPDMVMLDVMMPGMTGTDVLEQLRATPATSDILVMMMSASFLGTVADMGSPPHADDYMAKPFSPGEPQSRVAALFERRSVVDRDPTERH
jgi:DNA-binding response OmpR family regulator